MPRRRALQLGAIGTAAGAFSGLLGVGGGTVIVPLLIFWLGYEEREATGTSLAAICVIAALAAAGQAIEGNVDVVKGALVGIPAVGGVIAGTALQQRIPQRAVSLLADPPSTETHVPALHELRAQAQGLASSEEELLLLGLFGAEEVEPLLRSIRERASGDDTLETTMDRARAERIREIVRIVQETGVGEVTIEEEGMRVTVRRTPEPGEVALPAPGTGDEAGLPPRPGTQDGIVRIEAPMVGTFYRAPQPGAPPFVEVGDPVAVGQTLCILEAMKLMNEVKAELAGIVRGIHVENAEPVEFGQLLFEVEPVTGAPLDAL